MPKAPYERWGPNQPLSAKKLNVPLDRGIFEVTASGIARARRQGNAVNIHVANPFGAIIPGYGTIVWNTGFTSPSTLGGGKYWGITATDTTAALALTGDLATTDVPGTTGGETVIIINMYEVGKTTHALTTTLPYMGMFIKTPAANGMRVVAVWGFNSLCGS